MKIERFVRTSQVAAPREMVYAWHVRPGALERLSPPWERPEVLEPGKVANGARTVLRVPLAGPLGKRWVAEHEDVRPGHGFRDVQVEGPFARWVHEHRFVDGPEGTTIVEDSIEYALPLGGLGRAFGAGTVARKLDRTFGYRHAVLAGDVERHRAWAPPTPWTIAVTGATGFVGSALVPFLTTGGHCVKRIGRGPASDVRWDPEKGQLDHHALEGVDAVIHLAGESVASRWTQARKARILESRVQGTRLLGEALKKLAQPPRVLVSASAIGFYGDRGDEVLDESSARGSGFLADVCEAWEREANEAAKLGVRVVTPRIGVVLGASGGALARMLPPFRMGLGGPVGDGRAWMSWIALDDLIGVLAFSAFRDEVRGPVNAVAPHAVQGREFAQTLGRVLERPAFLPAPAAALRLAFGEMAQAVLLASGHVRPAALERAGFAFRHPTLEEALRFELGVGPFAARVTTERLQPLSARS